MACPLKTSLPAEGGDISGMQQRLKKVAESLRLPLIDRTRIYNSRLAQELGKWAEAEGKGDGFHDALFRAYFAESKNIADADELVNLAASIGLSRDEARRMIQTRAYRDAVDADWTRSRALGITGVPTFIIAEKRLVGFQPYEQLEEFLKGCGVKKR